MTSSTAETPVARLFQSLSNDQRKRICFPFDHPLRTRVESHWAIVKPRIADLTTRQQALCHEIFKNLCSEEGHRWFTRQMDDDAGGFANYHVALFGEPGPAGTDQPFEWVLTGRHNTLRADGHRTEGPAFSGPLFYGHAAGDHAPQSPDHAGNIWRYQRDRANAIFSSLDDQQRARALVIPGAMGCAHSDPDSLAGQGLAVAGLDLAQKQGVQQLLTDLVRPFRSFGADAIQKCLREATGVDALRLTFYQGDGRAWAIWKLEGPDFAWHFHGTPHVHAWLNLTP